MQIIKTYKGDGWEQEKISLDQAAEELYASKNLKISLVEIKQKLISGERLFSDSAHYEAAGLHITCSVCQVKHVLDVSPEQYEEYKKTKSVVRTFKNLSAGERELIISGICGDCFDKLFGEDE